MCELCCWTDPQGSCPHVVCDAVPGRAGPAGRASTHPGAVGEPSATLKQWHISAVACGVGVSSVARCQLWRAVWASRGLGLCLE